MGPKPNYVKRKGGPHVEREQRETKNDVCTY